MSSLVREGMPAVLFAVTLAVLVRGWAGPLTNADTYFHLRFGQEFLHSWSLREPGSVTSAATAHWVPTQWLPEMAMAQMESWFGLPGVAWLGGAGVVALLVAWYVAARRRAEPLVAVALVGLALAAASLGLSARPQVISYVLVVVTVDAWLRTSVDHRIRWWLVPVTWLWAMCHGMWPVGIGLGCVALIGIVLDRDISLRQSLKLATVPLLSATAAALTPVGPELYVQILRVQQRSQFFSEWHSPRPTNHACLVLLCLLAVTFAAHLRNPWPGWAPILLLVVAGALALWAWRTVPVSAAMLVPLAAPALQGWIGRRPAPLGRRETSAVAAGCCLALIALAFLVPGRVPDPTRSPAWLQPTMAGLPQGTEVLSTWDFGGVLMWRFPQLDPISHGYGDTYTLPELERSAAIQTLAAGWVGDLQATGCRIALLPIDTPLAHALTEQEHWQVVRRSDGLEMLTAPSSWKRS